MYFSFCCGLFTYPPPLLLLLLHGRDNESDKDIILLLQLQTAALIHHYSVPRSVWANACLGGGGGGRTGCLPINSMIAFVAHVDLSARLSFAKNRSQTTWRGSENRAFMELIYWRETRWSKRRLQFSGWLPLLQINFAINHHRPATPHIQSRTTTARCDCKSWW